MVLGLVSRLAGRSGGGLVGWIGRSGLVGGGWDGGLFRGGGLLWVSWVPGLVMGIREEEVGSDDDCEAARKR